MTDEKRPDWVQQTLDKYVGKNTVVTSRPEVGRNLQAEMSRIQAVIDTVVKYKIPAGELVRLRQKTLDLLHILEGGA